MESVDPMDKWLDPPDYPQFSECDGCGETFDNEDLTKINGQWLCETCESEADNECQ